MSGMIGFWLSLLINLLVGWYFAIGYPRQLTRRFRDRSIPPLFLFLRRLLRPLGWILIVSSFVTGIWILNEQALLSATGS